MFNNNPTAKTTITALTLTILLVLGSVEAGASFPNVSYRSELGCDATKTLANTKGYNEGSCHSSWALAVAAAISDSHCRFHVAAFRYGLS